MHTKVSMVVGCLMAMTTTGLAWATCTPSVNEASQLVFASSSEGTSSCANLNPANIGCTISSVPGSCTVSGVFTAYAGLNSNGSLRWCATNPNGPNCLGASSPALPNARVDVVMVKGGTTGNTCGYNYLPDAVKGSGLGDKKSNGTYQNVNSVAICTDNEDQPAAPVVTTLQDCPSDIQQALDNGTFNTDFAIVGNISNGDSTTLCVRQTGGVYVRECINVESGATLPSSTDLPLCSEGPDVDQDGVGDGPLPLKKNITYTTSKVGDSSCYYTCLPPPGTFGGRSQCGYICK